MKVLFVINLALFFSLYSFAAPVEIANSGLKQIPLLELYSSESCSSCPPADEWISNLKNDPGLWKRFIPVVFHVDYWNHLGWKDKLSSEMMTKRQESMAATWDSNQVYTPALVLNGMELKAWRQTRTPSLPLQPKNTGINLTILQEPNSSFTITTDSTKNETHLLLQVALLGMNLISKITSGENSGQTLMHNFVVLKWESRRIQAGHSIEKFKLPITTSESGVNGRTAVVSWIEKENSPVPLQATGGYILR